MNINFAENTEGFLIPFENERSLVAQDPWSQAREWCREILVIDKECIVVGLGAGFHLAEMIQQKRLSKVYVVDSRPGLVNIFRSQFPELADIVQIILVEDSQSLLQHEIMEEVIEKSLSVFAFTPCWPENDTVFRSFHRHLCGRSAESLELFFKSRGLKKDIQIRDETGKRYLTIKDLEILIQEEVPAYLRLNCFRILKELIL
jgi:hypothetical protein